ncbi:chromate efflux transporter [Sulfuriferula nivalis]|uniref:chromate efflux transporter n=1 Tax=Sulfuriferula nivalis TaxID=2675298 RepID=UPI001389FDEB|nr:chromate efflux transporter [Sulfuriferula nivalis]
MGRLEITLPKEHQHPLEIFLIFLRLGLTSFGGPIAHLGYFRQEFVERYKWLDEHAYADLVSLCQFLPGPASSQVGIAIGLSRGGVSGAIASWLGFTLPSAILLVIFGLSSVENHLGSDWLHGLKIAAVAVVAQALWVMGKSLSPDKIRATIAICAAAMATLIPSSLGQLAAIAAGGFFGWAFLNVSTVLPHNSIQTKTGRNTGMALLMMFFILLVLLPVAASSTNSHIIKLFDSFYRVGSLVFGGGHVVLPLLQSQVVPSGWISNDAFLAGYGAAQAIPGPLFTFAAYLGAVSTQTPSSWAGAGIALTAIFLPSFLLIIGILPFWEQLRRYKTMQRAMLGINAAVVGILLAAFYNPVWISSIRSPVDFCLASTAFLLLVFWKSPPWLVVLLAALVTGLGIG